MVGTICIMKFAESLCAKIPDQLAPNVNIWICKWTEVKKRVSDYARDVKASIFPGQNWPEDD